MSKQYILRHKETKKQLFTSGGRKCSWKAINHAKSAFTNLHWHSRLRMDHGVTFNGRVRFAEQDIFEVVEVDDGASDKLAEAYRLLRKAHSFMDDVHAYDSTIAGDIREFLGMGE